MKHEIYDEKCPICNGCSFIFIEGAYKMNLSGVVFDCPMCNGKGFVDWINIVKVGRGHEIILVSKTKSFRTEKIRNNIWRIKGDF